MQNKILMLIITLVIFSIASYADLSASSITLSDFIGEEIPDSITITNNGNGSVSDISVTNNIYSSFTPTGGTLGQTSLNPGESTTYSFTVTVPDSESTVTDDHTIGSLLIQSNGTSDITVNINFEPKPRLKIDEVDITVDDDDESVSEGENIDAKRGSLITLEFEVQNEFTSSSDIDINDVEVTVYNDELDIDEDDEIDVDASDEEKISFTFEIDDDADDGSETIEIRVEGEDEDGIIHVDIFEFDLDIDVASREVLISDAYFSPSIVTCERSTTLYVDIKNTGKRDLDEAMVIMDIDDAEWDFTDYIKNIEIDEGDSYTARISFIIPEDVPANSYLIEVTSYYDGGTSDDSDTETIPFEIARCVETDSSSSEDDSDYDYSDSDSSSEEDIIINSGNTVNIPPNANFATSKKSDIFDFDSTQGIVLLVLINIIIVGIIIAVTVAIVKKD